MEMWALGGSGRLQGVLRRAAAQRVLAGQAGGDARRTHGGAILKMVGYCRLDSVKTSGPDSVLSPCWNS